MITDPARIVDDLEAKVVDEQAVIDEAGPPEPAAEDLNQDTPGAPEPTD
jgi:hypothetical protein